MNRNILLTTGIALIVLGVGALGASLWEGFGGFGKNFHVVDLPGFHEIDLKEPGLYGGVYQHQGTGPMPVRALSQMDVRVMFKQTYESIPVLMNTAGQTFDRFGLKGMPVFNFFIQEAGVYTLSAIYLGKTTGPTIPVIIVSQAAASIKQTLIVGVLFFSLFLGLGIMILVKLNRWVPKAVK